MAPSTRTSRTAGETSDSTAGNVGAASDENTEEVKAEAPTGSVLIKFTGASVVDRRLSKKDFKDSGVDFDQDVSWNPDNKHTVDASDWPSEVVDFVGRQPKFKVVRKGD